MDSPDRKKALERRIYLEKRHRQYLLTVADNPASLSAEIERHQSCIQDLKKEIEAHEAALDRLVNTRDNHRDLIKQSDLKLKYFEKELKALLAANLIQEYIAVNKRLKQEDK